MKTPTRTALDRFSHLHALPLRPAASPAGQREESTAEATTTTTQAHPSATQDGDARLREPCPPGRSLYRAPARASCSTDEASGIWADLDPDPPLSLVSSQPLPPHATPAPPPPVMISPARTPEPLSQVGTPLSPLPPTLSYVQPTASPQIAIHPPPPTHGTAQPPQPPYTSSRFSNLRFPVHSAAASSAVSQAGVGSGHGRPSTNANGSTTGSLAKKASKPFLGWFTRKLRKSMGSAAAGAAGAGPPFNGQGSSSGRPQSPRRVQARRTSSWTGSVRASGGRQPARPAAPSLTTTTTAAADFDSINAESDYGRLVANNGLRYLQAGSSGTRLRRTLSELSEGDRASSLAARDRREQAARQEAQPDDEPEEREEDGGDYQSVATSLDPFPPSLHHRPSTRHQSISSSRWTPSSFTASSSSSTLDDYSTTASVSLRPGGPPSSHIPYQRGRARSEAHPGFRSRDHTPDTHLRDSDVASELGADGTEPAAAFDDDDDDDNDEGASLRPMPPSIPPSPSPSNSVARTIAPSVASSRSPSYAASLAPSSRGWRSVVTTSSSAATPTTAVTSVDGGSTSTGRAESIIIQGPMAHIAQPPPSLPALDNVSPRSVSGPLPPTATTSGLGAASSPTTASPLRTHNRRESWTSGSFSPLLEQPPPSSSTTHPSSPLAQSLRNGSAGARPRAPSSPPAPFSGDGAGSSGAGLSRWGSVAPSPHAVLRPASLAASQRDGPWSGTVRPTSLLSHALATSALAGPAANHRPPADPSSGSLSGGLEPPVVLMPPPPLLGSPIAGARTTGEPLSQVSAADFDPLAPSSSFSSLSPLHAQHLYAPTHSTPHVRNNPHPSAPPNDNASLLTLASSSFFGPTGNSLANGTGSIRTTGGGSSSIRNGIIGGGGGGGRAGYAPSIVSASIRRGVERAESISFSFTGPGYVPGGVGTPGTGGRRQVDDAGASVRAIRRKGSWESGESRWSAAAPSSASILGRGSFVRPGGERDSTIGLWGGPPWGAGGTASGGGTGGGGGGGVLSHRQGSILTVDLDGLAKDGSVARSVSFSFRSHAGDEDDGDDDGDPDRLDDVGEDGGSSRMSRRRRRSSSAHSASTGSSRPSSSASSRFSDDDDHGDLPPIILPLDPDYQRRNSDHEDDADDDEGDIDSLLLPGGASLAPDGRSSSRESGTEEEVRTPGPPLQPLAYPEPLWKAGRGIVA